MTERGHRSRRLSEAKAPQAKCARSADSEVAPTAAPTHEAREGDSSDEWIHSVTMQELVDNLVPVFELLWRWDEERRRRRGD